MHHDPFPSQPFFLIAPQNFTKIPSKPRDHEPRFQVPTVRVFASNKFPRGTKVRAEKLHFQLKQGRFFAREVEIGWSEHKSILKGSSTNPHVFHLCHVWLWIGSLCWWFWLFGGMIRSKGCKGNCGTTRRYMGWWHAIGRQVIGS